ARESVPRRRAGDAVGRDDAGDELLAGRERSVRRGQWRRTVADLVDLGGHRKHVACGQVGADGVGENGGGLNRDETDQPQEGGESQVRAHETLPDFLAAASKRTAREGDRTSEQGPIAETASTTALPKTAPAAAILNRPPDRGKSNFIFEVDDSR